MTPRHIPQNLENPVVMATWSSSSKTRLQPFMFSTLYSDGSNFLKCINNAKITLAVEDLAATLEAEGADEILSVYKSQALLILYRHLDQILRLQYIQVDDPTEL